MLVEHLCTVKLPDQFLVDASIIWRAFRAQLDIDELENAILQFLMVSITLLVLRVVGRRTTVVCIV